MASLDTIIPGKALSLINRFGTTVQLTTVAEGNYNPATSQASNVAASAVTLKAIIEEYAESLRFLGDKLEPGSQIIEGDKKLTIAAQGLATIPKAGDLIAVLGTSYYIVGVASQMASEVVALYVLHIRKV